MDEWDALGFELYEEDKRQLQDCCERIQAICAKFSITVCDISVLLRDFGVSLSEAMDEILAQIGEGIRPRQRKRWPRPKNDRIKPLLLDRRPKLYRCRNNC